MNWKQEIEDAIKANDDELISCTLTEVESSVEFDSGYGSAEGKPFTAWGKKYVYFPTEYDGSEGIGFAPRFPDDGEITGHI